jgi:hypothetical protein
VKNSLESRSRSERLRLCALVLGALCACRAHDGSTSTEPGATPVTRNLGAAAVAVFGEDGFDLVYVSEAAQGGLDLNGDGDAEDLVAHLFDSRSRGLVNTGLAVSYRRSVRGEVVVDWPVCSGELAAFPVDEEAQGADLNGDGDQLDRLAFVAERASGAIVNLGLAYGTPEMGPPETNPRNRAAGPCYALRTVDPRTGAPRLVVHDARTGRRSESALVGDRILELVDGWVYFLVAETPGLDLNGDGDEFDEVLVAFDSVSGRHWITGLATTWSSRMGGSAVGVLVWELAQGGLDLDGNGSNQDLVFHVVDASAGLVRNTRLTVDRQYRLNGAGERFLVPASEAAAQRDWNGDGDQEDHVVQIVEAANGYLPVSTGLAVERYDVPMAGSGDWLAIPVDERAQGLDLDGDGQLAGGVLHLLDARSGALVNTGLPGARPTGVAGHLLISSYTVDELGDPHLALLDWNVRDEVLRETGVAAFVFRSRRDVAVLTVPESLQGADLNGDGDLEDIDLALFDARTATVHRLGLAIPFGDSTVGSGSALVSESAQGQDLNGDGDLADQVLHAIGLDR